MTGETRQEGERDKRERQEETRQGMSTSEDKSS